MKTPVNDKVNLALGLNRREVRPDSQTSRNRVEGRGNVLEAKAKE